MWFNVKNPNGANLIEGDCHPEGHSEGQYYVSGKLLETVRNGDFLKFQNEDNLFAGRGPRWEGGTVKQVVISFWKIDTIVYAIFLETIWLGE